MVRVNLPHVHRFIDRHGRVRCYLRMPGRKSVALPGLPGTPQFHAAYEAAIRDQPADTTQRIGPGTLAAVALAWKAGPTYREVKATTRRVYDRLLNALVAEHGDKPMRLFEPRHIKALVTAKSATPAAANHRLRMLRALCRQALDDEMITVDPTRDVRRLKEAGRGTRTWTEADIAAYEARWPTGTRERLWMALLLYTGQRRSDAVRMGWPHVTGNALALRQVKTGADLTIPLHASLAAELANVPRDRLLFIVTRGNAPMMPNGFYMRFKVACRAAGLPTLAPHGLRKAAARRLAEAGCTPHEIMAITGHQTLAEVERYTRAADQVRLAGSAMGRIVELGRK